MDRNGIEIVNSFFYVFDYAHFIDVSAINARLSWVCGVRSEQMVNVPSGIETQADNQNRDGWKQMK